MGQQLRLLSRHQKMNRCEVQAKLKFGRIDYPGQVGDLCATAGVRQELADQPLQARVNVAAKRRLPSEDASIVYEDCENRLDATNVSLCPLFSSRG
jgi:hypothetical protein